MNITEILHLVRVQRLYVIVSAYEVGPEVIVEVFVLVLFRVRIRRYRADLMPRTRSK